MTTISTNATDAVMSLYADVITREFTNVFPFVDTIDVRFSTDDESIYVTVDDMTFTCECQDDDAMTFTCDRHPPVVVTLTDAEYAEIDRLVRD